MTSRSSTLIALVMTAACGTARTPETGPAAEAAPTKLEANALETTAHDEASATQHQQPLPVWFNPALGLQSVDDAAAKLDAKNALGFAVLARDGQLRMPTTCRERESIKARGFAPETKLQAQTDADAEIRCETLHLLTHAQPARATFLPMTLDESVLSQLPAAVATALSNERALQRDAATRAGKSLRDIEPHASVRIDAHDAPVIVETALGTSINLELQARGDFDGDGTEDMAVSVLNGDGHGSYTEMRLLVLTRADQKAMLAVMR
jgi:hypothetical protein